MCSFLLSEVAWFGNIKFGLTFDYFLVTFTMLSSKSHLHKLTLNSSSLTEFTFIFRPTVFILLRCSIILMYSKLYEETLENSQWLLVKIQTIYCRMIIAGYNLPFICHCWALPNSQIQFGVILFLPYILALLLDDACFKSTNTPYDSLPRFLSLCPPAFVSLHLRMNPPVGWTIKLKAALISELQRNWNCILKRWCASLFFSHSFIMLTLNWKKYTVIQSS